MQKKYFSFQPKGMNTELSPKIHSNEYATYMKNIRFTNEDNGTLSIQFEKGTKKYEIGEQIKGYILGNCVINDYVILFTINPIYKNNDNSTDDSSIDNKATKTQEDYIYKLEFNINENNEETPIITEIFKGNLGFNINNPISTLGVYENENIQKVYWIDGINPIRVINVKGDYSYYNTEGISSEIKNSAFDFIPVLNFEEKITVTKDISYGNFPQGTIQYVFSYYNKNGRQSNLFAQSELQYLSYAKGVAADEKVHCNFNIKIDNIDKQFDYLRVYSIIRTTKDSTPTCKRVIDIELKTENKDDSISFIDDGTIGDTIDNTELLYFGGYNLCPNVFEQKDNTLFLANYTVQNNDFTQNEINDIRERLIPLVNNTKSNGTISLKFIENTDDKQKIRIKGNTYYNYEGELLNSNVAVFKYLEYYGFAIQFQNINGRYSTPIYLGSVQNLIPNKVINNETINPAVIHLEFDDNSIEMLDEVIDINIWTKCRLLMVNPTESLRTIKCQGIVSSTVFNYYDRNINAPYGMSSWRMLPLENHLKPLASNDSSACEIQNIISSEDNLAIKSLSKNDFFEYQVILRITPINVFQRQTYISVFKIVSKDGKQTSTQIGETRNWGHNIGYEPTSEQITNYATQLADVIIEDIFKPSNIFNVTKEMCIFTFNDSFFANKESVNQTTFIIDMSSNTNNFLKEQFAIDESVITLNSPDIEEQYNSISDNCKLRIIGVLGEKEKFSNYLFQSEGQRDSTALGMINNNTNDFKNIIGWQDVDYLWDGKSDTKSSHKHNFVTYLWHRTTTFADIGQDLKGENNYDVASKIKQKIISNTRICDTIYLQDLLKYNDKANDDNVKFTHKDLTPNKIQAILTNKDSLYSLNKEPITDIVRLFNNDVNKLFPSYDEYTVKVAGSLSDLNATTYNDLIVGESTLKIQDPVQIKYKESPNLLIDISSMSLSDSSLYTTLPKIHTEPNDTKYKGFKTWSKDDNPFWLQITEKDIKSNTKIYNRENIILPFIVENSEYIVNAEVVSKALDENKYNVARENFYNIVDVTNTINKYQNLFYLADIVSKEENPYEQYTYTEDNRLVYNKDIISQYSFIPITDTINCNNDAFSIESHIGDTYYQRWDCLKTFPYSTDDKQQYIDITSFFVESRINIDGRYDKQRGLSYNLGVLNTNFNLINSNYTQLNNYFSYRDLYIEDTNSFPNQLTYTKAKTLGEDIDTWTNLTLANTFDLDGTKGSITDIKTYNNNLYCFQDDAISRLLFNSRVQINTSDGVPIEIANNAKLDDKVYISDTIGCIKKQSISKSPNGIYFIDNKRKALYRLNDQGIQPISDNKFNKFFKEHNIDTKYITFFDLNTSDLYISDTLTCIAFNEKLNEFTSYYSYSIDNKNLIFNLKDKTLQFVLIPIDDENKLQFKSDLRELYKGDYGNFYDYKDGEGFIKYASAELEFIVNPEFDGDKIFETVEFNDDNIYPVTRKVVGSAYHTFDLLEVSNEYQSSTSDTSNIKKKFRTWRWQISRDKRNRDRIRNMWAKINLIKEHYQENRKIYGINVAYYI